MGSGCAEPSLTTSLQWKQGVQGVYALVRGGSSTSNLLEPSDTCFITLNRDRTGSSLNVST